MTKAPPRTIRFICMRSPDHEGDALTELGRKQAAAVIDQHLQEFRFTKLFHSDNKRSKELAELMGSRLGARHSHIQEEKYFGYHWAEEVLKPRHQLLIKREEETGAFIRIRGKEPTSAMNWLQYDAQSQIVAGRFTGLLLEIADQILARMDRDDDDAQVFIASHRGSCEMPALMLDQQFPLLRPAEAVVYTIAPHKNEDLHIAAITHLQNPLSKK